MAIPLTIIVAATKANGIGQNGSLPWRLPKEMSYFARATSSAPEGRHNTVLMGRRSWESIPPKFRPLAKRVNIVVSRNKEYDLGPSKSQSPAYCEHGLTDALRRMQSVENAHRHFIIGGGSLYNESLLLLPSSPAFVDRLLLTRILSPDFECDTFMAKIVDSVDCEDGKPAWILAEHKTLEEWVGFEVPKGVQEENGVKYEFQMWVRARYAKQE